MKTIICRELEYHHHIPQTLYQIPPGKCPTLWSVMILCICLLCIDFFKFTSQPNRGLGSNLANQEDYFFLVHFCCLSLVINMCGVSLLFIPSLLPHMKAAHAGCKGLEIYYFHFSCLGWWFRHCALLPVKLVEWGAELLNMLLLMIKH